MSRIGRSPVRIPSGVEVTLDGAHMQVKGGKATLERTLPREMKITVDGDVITVERPTDSGPHRSLHGLTRTLIANMIEGVSKGYRRDLDIVGVGFRAAKQGEDIILNLGYSHPIRYTPPVGVTIEVPTPTSIAVLGANKEVVGEVAAKIRSFRGPEPYKGKGVMYKGEKIRRKPGKSGKAGKGAG